MINLSRLKKLISVQYLALVITVLATGVGFVGARAYASKSNDKVTDCMGTCVSIFKDGFSQSELAVEVGSFVEFRSADGQSHNLALGDGSDKHEVAEDHSVGHTDGHSEAPDVGHEAEQIQEHTHDHVVGTESGTFGADEAWRVQFKKPGTYVIHDHLHPELTILVVVYQKNM